MHLPPRTAPQKPEVAVQALPPSPTARTVLKTYPFRFHTPPAWSQIDACRLMRPSADPCTSEAASQQQHRPNQA